MSLQGRSVLVIGTLDTKAREVGFLAATINENFHSHATSLGIHVSVADVSIRALVEGTDSAGSTWTLPPGISAISCEEILEASGHEPTQLRGKSKGEAIDCVAGALKHFLLSTAASGQLAGAIGLGGSCGASLAAPALRALPLGLPKILLSTVASVNAAQLVGTSDLMLLPSVADISGLNAVLRPVLSNAAAALAAMAQRFAAPAALDARALPGHARPTVGITMFGVTTPCVTAVQCQLDERGFDSVVFHATGVGGRAMEELLDAGTLQGVIDVTTTEVADLVVGGVLACDTTRFDAAIRKGLPLLLSVGALDMINFGAPSSVPERFRGRTLYEHNPQVTLMRTTPEESKAIAEFIAGKVNRSSAPVQVLFPEKGVSALDKEGQPFFQPQADLALLLELRRLIHSPPQKQVTALPFHINDPEFALALVDVFCNLYAGILQPGQAPAHQDEQGFAQGPEARADCVELGREPSSALLTPEQMRVHRIRQRIQPQLALLRAEGPVEIPGLAERRRAILERLRAQIDAGRPLIGGGAGTGISAKCEEAGGVDLIVIYNSGRFRMAGRGSLAGLLPFKDANAVVVEMASEVLPVVKAVPVLAGVCATDPFRVIPRFLRELAALGFAGVQNFPTVGLMDGVFRQNLEETGMGFGLEVEMVAVASVMGFLTTPYAFCEEEARDMAAAGADVVVAHMGLTTAGTIGALTALTLDQSVERVQAIADAARSVKENVIVLCHGGPISGPAEAEYILERTRGVHGFYGASSMERLPVELAMVDNLKKYKEIKLR